MLVGNDDGCLVTDVVRVRDGLMLGAGLSLGDDAEHTVQQLHEI